MPTAWAQEAPALTPVQAELKRAAAIELTQLSSMQIDNLAVTAKVWGFLKYHHPAVTSGQQHWDQALLEILPSVLAAPDRASADRVLRGWISRLGAVPACQDCATLEPAQYQLLPSLAWLQDDQLLSAELRDDLKAIYRNRARDAKQFYVTLTPMVGNPVFEQEAAYADLKFPDSGYQLLALFRFWNVIEYWAPYRDQIGADWDQVLRASIAPLALAPDRNSYELALMALIAQVHDTHSNLWSSLHLRPPVGACALPVRLRFVQDQAVVSGYTSAAEGMASGLQRGDILTELDGVPLAQLLTTLQPYYAASNQAARLRDVAGGLTRGACGSTQLVVQRDGALRQLAVARIPDSGPSSRVTHDKPGDTFQLINDQIAYIKLSSIRRSDVPAYMERAARSKGLIIDIRNYPSDFVPFALGQYLVEQPTPFVRFTVADLANPGGFKWSKELMLQPQAPHYAGKVVILVDERSQSQSEYTAMALRASPRALVLGSTTAGADGNISALVLPGGLKTVISGIGVFYPDKRPTQRIGIVPDIVVSPTVAGLREQRDEVLEAAIRVIERE
ncbi:S41 family peptidase [Pseudoduganella danionis]|nr:S41 family peptidase [Pseudoduganella danionis]